MAISILLKNLSIAATSTVAIGFLASSANALTLASSSGTWSNVVGGSGIITQTVGSENQVRWGTPATANGKSGLGFTGVSSLNFNVNDIFQIGTLRHFNNPISGGTAASGVDLSLALNFSDPIVNQAFNFTFTIDETPNAGTCAYFSVTPCADKISFSNAVASNSFNIGGTDYTLQLLGFSDTPGGTPVADFISQEGGISTTKLYGKITVAPPKGVPEPTATLGLLTFTALGAGSVLKRKREQAAKA